MYWIKAYPLDLFVVSLTTSTAKQEKRKTMTQEVHVKSTELIVWYQGTPSAISPKFENSFLRIFSPVEYGKSGTKIN